MEPSVIDPISSLDKNAQMIYEKQTEEEMFFIIQINSSSAVCPTCKNCSTRIHSRYCRNMDDLPASDRHVHFQIISHKWFCDNPECSLTIFTERLSWIRSYQRKTNRLEKVIEKIAFSTNCLTAEKVCHSLHIPTSHDTLLRRVKTVSFENKILPFVGIDDFAFKKRMSYGTIFIDLKTNQPVDLLDTRRQQDVTQWLKARPNIELITRDGSKTYAKAVAEASSSILQVSDRWHILHQLFEAIKKTISDTIPVRWKPQQPGQPDEKQKDRSPLLTRKSDVQRIQNEEKRWTRIQKVQRLYKQGYTVKVIQEMFHISRGTVYKDLRQTEKPNHQRASPYQKYRPLIHSLVLKKQSSQQIEENCRAEGYTGSRATLNTMIAEERRNTKMNQAKSYSLRQQIIRIIWDFKESDHKKQFLQLHSRLLHAFPVLKEIDELVHSFRNLFIKKDTKALDDWVATYDQQDFPHVQAFINGLKQDIQAVKLSVQEDWNNGVTEGNVNRLKTIKRLMYGRASFSVLKNRVLYQF